MSEFEKMQFLGGRTHKGDRIMNTLRTEEIKYTAVNDLPTSVDWRDQNVIPPTRDQVVNYRDKHFCGKEIIIFGFLNAYF